MHVDPQTGELIPEFRPDMSATIGKLAEALCAAQGEFPNVGKSKTVTVQPREGRSYSFSYAPLGDILRETRPVLVKHGLALSQMLTANGGPSIRTMLMHASGEWIGSEVALPSVPARVQELGSLVTYMRRYALAAILGIAPDDDDDGNAADGNGVKTVAETPKRAPAKAAKPPADLTDEADTITNLIEELAKAGAINGNQFKTAIQADYGVSLAKELTKKEGAEVLAKLRTFEAKAKAAMEAKGS